MGIDLGLLTLILSIAMGCVAGIAAFLFFLGFITELPEEGVHAPTDEESLGTTIAGRLVLRFPASFTAVKTRAFPAQRPNLVAVVPPELAEGSLPAEESQAGVADVEPMISQVSSPVTEASPQVGVESDESEERVSPGDEAVVDQDSLPPEEPAFDAEIGVEQQVAPVVAADPTGDETGDELTLAEEKALPTVTAEQAGDEESADWVIPFPKFPKPSYTEPTPTEEPAELPAEGEDWDDLGNSSGETEIPQRDEPAWDDEEFEAEPEPLPMRRLTVFDPESQSDLTTEGGSRTDSNTEGESESAPDVAAASKEAADTTPESENREVIPLYPGLGELDEETGGAPALIPRTLVALAASLGNLIAGILPRGFGILDQSTRSIRPTGLAPETALPEQSGKVTLGEWEGEGLRAESAEKSVGPYGERQSLALLPQQTGAERGRYPEVASQAFAFPVGLIQPEPLANPILAGETYFLEDRIVRAWPSMAGAQDDADFELVWEFEDRETRTRMFVSCNQGLIYSLYGDEGHHELYPWGLTIEDLRPAPYICWPQPQSAQPARPA